MPEIVRARDVILFKKGDNYPVTVSAAMATQGWPGGQGVQWATSTVDQLLVTFSDGVAAGFLLFGSDEAADKYTAMTGNQAHYRFATMYGGGSLFSTTTFEKYTWASRQAGPLVPLVYLPNDHLIMSLRGYWTKEDEWDLSGDPRGPLKDAFPATEALVVQPPTALTNQFMTIQVM